MTCVYTLSHHTPVTRHTCCTTFSTATCERCVRIERTAALKTLVFEGLLDDAEEALPFLRLVALGIQRVEGGELRVERDAHGRALLRRQRRHADAPAAPPIWSHE